MFATGSHDGAVRIWTTPEPLTDSSYSSRGTTNATTTPRSPTPNNFEVGGYRTDSPGSQSTESQDDSPGQLSPQTEEAEPLVSQRTVAFSK